jgi:hypothetical protein
MQRPHGITFSSFKPTGFFLNACIGHWDRRDACPTTYIRRYGVSAAARKRDDLAAPTRPANWAKAQLQTFSQPEAGNEGNGEGVGGGVLHPTNVRRRFF